MVMSRFGLMVRYSVWLMVLLGLIFWLVVNLVVDRRMFSWLLLVSEFVRLLLISWMGMVLLGVLGVNWGWLVSGYSMVI